MPVAPPHHSLLRQPPICQPPSITVTGGSTLRVNYYFLDTQSASR